MRARKRSWESLFGLYKSLMKARTSQIAGTTCYDLLQRLASTSLAMNRMGSNGKFGKLCTCAAYNMASTHLCTWEPHFTLPPFFPPLRNDGSLRLRNLSNAPAEANQLNRTKCCGSKIHSTKNWFTREESVKIKNVQSKITRFGGSLRQVTRRHPRPGNLLLSHPASFIWLSFHHSHHLFWYQSILPPKSETWIWQTIGSIGP